MSDDDVALLKTMAATAVGAVRWQHGHMSHAACRFTASISCMHLNYELWRGRGTEKHTKLNTKQLEF